MKKLNGTIRAEGRLSGGIEKASNLKGELSQSLARGPSAYEVAVDNGFKGTEQEWLESLKGYTPIRGIDYWTAQDVAAIKQELKAYIDSLLSEV